MKEWMNAERLLSLPSVPLGLTHLLPDEPGLYVAVITNEVGAAIVGYVGIATVSLYKRWGGHRSTNGKARSLHALAHAITLAGDEPNYVLVYYDTSITSEYDLRAAESDILSVWNPPLNAPRWGKGDTPLLTTDPPAWGAIGKPCGLIYVTDTMRPQYRIECWLIVQQLRQENYV